MPSTAVVTGANSGIGYCFAELLSKEGYEVHALDITVGEKMKKLGCKTYECDLSSEISIHSFAKNFKDEPLDLLLNVAGMCPLPDHEVYHCTLKYLVKPHLRKKTFTTNTFAPLLLTQSLLPSLLLSPFPRIGLMSSRIGSIADNSTGGSYAYRASKAALNSIGKSMAMDLREKGVLIVLMHPGCVKTGLDTSGRTHQMKEAVEPEEAAGKFWKLMQSKGLEETGRFWHREGYELEW